jgi:hypothetical protein
MPDLAMATDTICATLDAAWPDDRIEWPNVIPPDGAPKLNSGTDPWCALDLFWDGSGETAIGNRVFTRTGFITVRVFVPAGERGLEVANDLCKTIVNAFEGKTIDGVSFHNVGPKTVGPDGAGWFQVNVRADFEFDEVKQ